VWQPNTSQRRLIWTLAVVLILFWPSPQGRSLGIKTITWLADPMHNLPRQPAHFTFEDEDDAATVTAHDDQEAEYERAYASSALTRLRIHLRDMQEPFDPSTERQVLGAIAVLGALFIWRLGS
jgi:hypothetical protein